MMTIDSCCYKQDFYFCSFKLLVCGYTRQSQRNTTIPKEINDICLHYFYDCRDTFCAELAGFCMEISEDGSMVTYNPGQEEDGQTIFGEKEIESLNDEYVYIWKFKIIKRTMLMMVGLSSAGEIDDLNSFNVRYFEGFPYSYSYNGFNGGLTKNDDVNNGRESTQWNYGPKWHKGDIIEMVFDAKKRWLWYLINGKEVGEESKFNSSNDAKVAFSDIAMGKDIKYRMAVAIRKRGDSIRIVSFSVKKASL